ncbi:MAG TPA: M48 family metalloprotease [Opitutaceae bacterium]|nr:M48 family metalloprotease [Opitutaceae bacterium]
MDFFEAQARAKKRTSRLVVLFGLAVIGTVLAAYLAALIGVAQSANHSSRRHRRYDYSEPAPAAPFSLWQPQVFFPVALGTLAVVGLASLYKWNEFSSGGRAVAESVGARRVDPRTSDLAERRLLNVVEEMAIASGVPVPAVYILDDEPAINAFAAGLTTSDAVVTVTKGTLQKLTREELQGVIGHEFSHILNGDMRLNLRIAAIVFGILVLGLAGRGILWTLGRGRVRTRGKGGGQIVAVMLAVGVALLVIGYVGYFFGRMIQAAVSRQREFLADASSVQFTRNPGGITGALKKIGGYALGSHLDTHQAAGIGHFFFAQAFRSGFTGLWSTHPPLAERIRAVDPRFDGKFFEPPEVVDVGHESFVQAGLAPARPEPPHLSPRASVTGVAAIGTLTPAQIANAQLLLDALPPRLRAAAQTPTEAVALVYALLLADAGDANRERGRSLVAQHASADALRLVDELAPGMENVRREQKLPLLQLALPTLCTMEPAAQDRFVDALDALVHADGDVSTFEFALQKLLLRTLSLARKPTSAVVQIYSFNAVTVEISIVLSALAHCSVSETDFARAAFAAGAAQIKLVESQLVFVDETACNFEKLDAALDKLATASLPIKQRTLIAAAHVVNADGQVLVSEFELLRAISAALDCPMPPMTAAVADTA